MRTAIKTLGIIGIVLGGLAIIGGISFFEEGDIAGGAYSEIGGAFFLAQGILSVVFAGRKDRPA